MKNAFTALPQFKNFKHALRRKEIQRIHLILETLQNKVIIFQIYYVMGLFGLRKTIKIFHRRKFLYLIDLVCFSDISHIHEAIGDKLGTSVQYLSASIMGFVIIFYYGWKLALLMQIGAPVLVLSFALMGLVSIGAFSRLLLLHIVRVHFNIGHLQYLNLRSVVE